MNERRKEEIILKKENKPEQVPDMKRKGNVFSLNFKLIAYTHAILKDS